VSGPRRAAQGKTHGKHSETRETAEEHHNEYTFALGTAAGARVVLLAITNSRETKL
jgi:hypothetical protein